MSLFLHYLVQSILISWHLGLQQSILPNSISQILDSLVGVGGYPRYGATNNQCFGPSYTFVFRQDFGITSIGLIHFGAPLSLYAFNVHLRVIGFGFLFIGSILWVTFSLYFSLD